MARPDRRIHGREVPSEPPFSRRSGQLHYMVHDGTATTDTSYASLQKLLNPMNETVYVDSDSNLVGIVPD